MGASELLLVRHGESVANVAATAAEEAGVEVIDAPVRDADVPLSETGVTQAQALGGWLADRGPDRPDVVWCSPYLRAHETARLALESAGIQLPVRVDERLRDRDLGVLDLLTRHGVEARYPHEAARRRWLGKFYYRPPGGESWADLALRLRALMDDLDRLADGRRVLVVCHDAVILAMRYVCEGLSEAEVLQIGHDTTVRNASVTRLVRPTPDATWQVAAYSDVSHLEQRDAPPTEHPGKSDVLPQ